MAIPTNIKTLLSGNVVEWARIEFKETWNAEASLKTICAFANDIDNWGGGYIVIGVKEQDGRPSFPLQGVPPEKIDAYQKDLLNKCKLIQPEYLPIVEVVDYEGKKFIVIWAPGGNSRPYSSPKSFAKDSKERVHYIRKMASTIAPSEAEKRDLYNLANNIPFDDRVNHEADITDLNITLIQQYLKDIGSSLFQESMTMEFTDLCKSMNIVNTLPEYTKPKNVGLMFFNLEPERFFPCAQIDVVEFPDDTGDQIREKIFRGPIHHQLRDALQYIQNSVLQERVVKTDGVAEADRFFNYPYAAVEEALCNAVYHKGYDEREPIEVRVEQDRIIIVSHPGADRSITQEGLREYRAYSRRYRNRRIGEFLKEMHLTEGRNTGFRKICNALRLNGSPEPLFETDDERTYFATTIYIHPGFVPKRNTQIPIEGENDGVNDGVPEGVFEGLSKREIDILAAIRKNPKDSAEKIGKAVGVSKSTVERAQKKLKELSLIRRDGSDKTGRWIVRD